MHRRLAFLVFAVLAVLAVFASSSASAAPAKSKPASLPEGKPKASLGMPALQALDLNGDGHISRGEYVVGSRAFQRRDADKDGSVKLAECGPSEAAARDSELLGKADGDANGIVTRDELKAWQDRQFAALDSDHDGSLSPAEARPGQAPRGLGVLDRNGDGVLSGEEFLASSPLIDRYDVDGDGYLRISDLPGAGTDPRSKERFDHLDVNHDGLLTRDEAAAARRVLFRQLDTSGDGLLDAAELAAAQAARQGD